MPRTVPMNPMVDGWRGDDWFHTFPFDRVVSARAYNNVRIDETRKVRTAAEEREAERHRGAAAPAAKDPLFSNQPPGHGE